MIELFIGLVIATVLVFGIAAGNLFVCVLMTLGLIAPCLALAMIAYDPTIMLTITLVATALIWGPFLLRRG